ncbi:hypothetical protein MVEN_02532600 [Mycena venus]|uniref:Uncharacterized protein n=1 Tax=Mycena venus TaxID=2733690 RepID=A0A8H6WUU2_9AGAR|nr:hypothetical protein MVEN_02532600 [Mycena venus]
MDTAPPSILPGVRSSGGCTQIPNPQELIYADAELYRFAMMLFTQQPCLLEFEPSTVNDYYVPDANPETSYTAALRRHDQQYGVKHYLPSPSSKLPFAQYPSESKDNHNERSGVGIIPLFRKESLEARIFGSDREDAPPPAVRYQKLPDPWKVPITDAPLAINPQRTLKTWANVRTIVMQSSDSRPAPVQSSSRPIIPLPLRAQRNGVPLPSLPPTQPSSGYSGPGSVPIQSSSRPTIPLPHRSQPNGVPLPRSSLAQSSSDYSEGQGNGNKRKALYPPAPRPEKKAASIPVVPPSAFHPPAPSRPPLKSVPHKCSVDLCPETLPNKQAPQWYQQRHLHSRQGTRCSGCPLAFACAEDLQMHLRYNADCTTEIAPQLLQMFYLQPEVRAINPAVAPQSELMAYWRRFLEVTVVPSVSQ